MAGFSTTTVAYKLKAALFDAATNLWAASHPELLVNWGALAGPNIPDEYVLFLGTDSDQIPATLGTNRSREETLHVELQFFVTRWGEVNAAREADDYLYARIGELERHVRMTDTTLGGVVRHCFLASHNTDARSFMKNNLAGHLAAALVRFEAKARITA